MGKGKKNPYTVEQLLDSKLKNVDGESNEEVRKRMIEVVKEIISNHKGKKVAVVSHGAAMKYYLQNWCEYVYKEDALFFKSEYLCPRKLSSPCILELEFEEDEIVGIKLLENKKI